MTWSEYKKIFLEEVYKKEYDKKKIDELLFYAKKLFHQNLPVIFDCHHLSFLLGCKVEYIMKVSNSSNKFYRNFYINKRNGKKRKISEPLPSLKKIQKWILDEILYNIPVSDFAKAYVPGRSIKNNARFHKKKKLILNLDLKNFFPSITFDRVFYLFNKVGYSKGVSILLANLCLLDNGLPQGAPTSPAISNIVMHNFDKRISSFCNSKEVRYTRYADDMTFSGDFDPGIIIKFVIKILRDYELELNFDKIKTKRRHQAQIVTGVIVNEKIQAPRRKRKKLRQDIYYINKYGISSHSSRKNILYANYDRHLLGIANNILFLNKEDRDALFAIKVLSEIIKKKNKES